MNVTRPQATRSRWITGIAVCVCTVGLAALLGAAMSTPPAPTSAQLQPAEQEDYVGAASPISWRASTTARPPWMIISPA